MNRASLEMVACPVCRNSLTLLQDVDGPIQTGTLRCLHCQKDYAIVDGIPQFIASDGLTGSNRCFAGLYNWFSWFYRAFSKLAFAYIGMKEEEGRREILDRLDPHGGCVLEVSIGPGVNLPYLVNRPDVSQIFGLDISSGQLRRCQSYTCKMDWEVELFLGNGEQLPFQDNSFDAVFHVGGINFFNNKQAAISEMIRVAKPGTRILIADETEKGAQGYEKFIPGFKKSFNNNRQAIVPPVDLVPMEMLETRVFDAWKGWLYCLEFRKPL